MPELAAHLERVARELARINGVHLCQTCGHRRGEHAMDLVGEHFCEYNDGSGTDCCNCQNYVGVGRPNYAELVAALESAAAALAAYAREANERAAQCAESQKLGTGPQGIAAAIRALERAAGEKTLPTVEAVDLKGEKI